MRRAPAIIACFLYIATATEVLQVVKIPLLIIHYIEHNSASPMSLSEFFTEHYLRGDVYDADRNRDLQLPYKVEIPGVWSMVSLAPPHSRIHPPLLSKHNPSGIYLLTAVLEGEVPTIEHPPRE